MRALILSRNPRWVGGVVEFVNVLAANLAVSVIRVEIGCRLGPQSAVARWLRPAQDCIKLMRVLRTQQIDLVHLNPSLDAKALLRDGLFMAVLLAVSRFPAIVVFFHGWESKTEALIERNWFLRFAVRKVFNGAAAIIVLSPRFKQSLIAMGFDTHKIRVMSTMFDGRLFEGQNRNAGCSGKTLLFLSRFVREKGVYELLEGFRQASERLRDLTLVMAGDGPEREALDRWVESRGLRDRVRFTGFVRGEDKAKVLLDADIFVFPSYSEGCPMSLLEAMAAGLAIIATAVGGIPDIVQDGENGVLLGDLSPQAIAAAIERMVSDQRLCERVKENNRRKAWEKYEAKVVTRRLEAIYEEVIHAENRC